MTKHVTKEGFIFLMKTDHTTYLTPTAARNLDHSVRRYRALQAVSPNRQLSIQKQRRIKVMPGRFG